MLAVGHIAAQTTADIDPFRATAGEAALGALVHLQVVGEHPGCRAIDDIGKGHGVAKHLFRCALEPERIGVDHAAIYRQRMHDAQLAELTHEGAIGIDDRVPARDGQDLARFLLPEPL